MPIWGPFVKRPSILMTKMLCLLTLVKMPSNAIPILSFLVIWSSALITHKMLLQEKWLHKLSLKSNRRCTLISHQVKRLVKCITIHCVRLKSNLQPSNPTITRNRSRLSAKLTLELKCLKAPYFMNLPSRIPMRRSRKLSMLTLT